MKRRSALVACTCFAIAGLALGPAVTAQPMQHPGAGGHKGVPDLVITSFGLSSWHKCAPNEPLFTFEMSVKNQGSAGSSTANVFARDLKKPGWFTSVALPPVPPGESRTVSIPVYYYLQDPSWMSSGSPHPFQGTVEGAHNPAPGPATWMGKKVIMVDPPKGCGK
jgi:hypothetical protein